MTSSPPPRCSAACAPRCKCGRRGACYGVSKSHKTWQRNREMAFRSARAIQVHGNPNLSFAFSFFFTSAAFLLFLKYDSSHHSLPSPSKPHYFLTRWVIAVDWCVFVDHFHAHQSDREIVLDYLLVRSNGPGSTCLKQILWRWRFDKISYHIIS